MPSPLSMLKVPRFNRCVSFVLNMSKKVPKESVLFVPDERSEQISFNITEEVDSSSER